MSWQISRRNALGLLGSGAIAGLLPPYSLAKTPRKGGRLRIGLAGGSTTDSQDPATWASYFGEVVLMGAVYNNLVEIDADNRAIPELAEEWEAKDEGKTWIFKIRRGVEFHNGKSLDPSDVVASINHHRGSDSKSGAKAIMSSIQEMRADGDLVIFSLQEPNADFPYLLNDYHLVIMPSLDGKASWEDSIGTGGYKLASFNPGVNAELSRARGYWKSNRAHFDEVDAIALGDVAARMNALATGEVDVINRVDTPTMHLLARNEKVKILDTPGNQHFTFPMFQDAAPFNDNNVRLALKYSIDRKELLAKILFGKGKVANDHPVGPGNLYFAADLEQRIYDPDKARFHLKKAGLTKLDVELFTSEAAFGGAVNASELFSQSARASGINIQVTRAANDAYWDNIWLKKSFCASYWGGRPTADNILSLVYSKDAPWNESHFDDSRFNELLSSARRTLDETKRQEMYREAQIILKDQGSSIIPLYANWVDAHSTQISTGDRVASNWELDGYKAIERWWFNS